MEFTTKQNIRFIWSIRPNNKGMGHQGDAKIAPGKFDGLAVIKWYAENVFLAEAAESRDLLSKPEAERLMLNLKAELLQVEVDREKGKFVEVEKVKKEWVEVATAAKAMLQNIPYRLAAIVATLDNETEIRNTLKTEIRNILNLFAEGKNECRHCGGQLWNPADENKI
jgi:phage terminase Nu1 subunit (DNA packaging protein)